VRPGHLVPWRPVEWLDLVVPTVAILAAFAAIGLIVTAIRQGRAIRRLEERLARTGDAAVDAPLQRIADLQARHATSSSRSPDIQRQVRMGAVIGVTALVLIAAGAGVWYLFVRDDGGSASADSSPPAAAQQAGQKAPAAPPPDQAAVPEDVPQIDKGAHTVAVFNASGIDGVAGDIVAPALENEGYQVPLVANPPDGDSDRQKSVVMYSQGQRKAAQNVAKDLGVTRAPPLDGYTDDQVGDADVIVLVGMDIANGGIAATP
jgi:LytR cell envelope-related transcriptional attenuator